MSSVANDNNAPQITHPQGHVHQHAPALRRDHSHGGRNRAPAPTPRTSEEGVRTIEIILTQSVLCSHAVDDLKRVYRDIELLERKVEQIPTCNSLHALEKIIEKVQLIFRSQTITPLDLISLYHLQNFSPRKMPLKDCFITVLGRFKESTKDLSEVACNLPHCSSEDVFEKDAQALMGADRSEGITKILDHKKEQIRGREETEQKIEQKKLELRELRRKDSDNYPGYFDELLEGGYLHLFEHLMIMKDISSPEEREAKIKEMSFSLFSHVVLETREAVIQKVIGAISAIPTQGRTVLFLIGGSGAGKSTTMCLLRGDKMELITPGYYYASQNDRDKLVGHQGATSCTFLPTTEVVGDLVVVDFPGFEDSKGRVISLGLECALEALTEMFQPKILALESITNINGRYAAAAKLGSRLSRLLASKECILGITKYSKDPDFRAIKAIEEGQRKEEEQRRKELETPSAQEQGMIVAIQSLVGMNMEALQPKIEELQQQLITLQQARLQKREEPLSEKLPETEQKTKHRKEVEQREKDLSTAIGLKEIVKFDDLETAGIVDICRSKLSDCPCSRANTQHLLDPNDKAVVKEVFEKDLLPKMLERKDYRLKFEDFKDFERSVLESSLVRTIFAESNPEIGLFLHLPEIDPKIVREIDLAIASDCFIKYRNALIQMLDVEAIYKTLGEIKGKAWEQRVREIKEKVLQLQKYLMNISGITDFNNPGEMQKKWNKLRADFNASKDVVDKKKFTPSWLIFLVLGPTGIGFYGIGALIDWRERKKREQKDVTELLDQCSKDLDQRYETLLNLKEIEMVIQKQEVIEEAFNSAPISMESIDAAMHSIQQKIEALRTVYGSGDWDKRVEIMASHLTSTLPPASNPYVAHLLLYACMGPSHIVAKPPRVNRADPVLPAATQHKEKGIVMSVVEKMTGAKVTSKLVSMMQDAYLSRESALDEKAWLAARKLAVDTQGTLMEGVWLSTFLKDAAQAAVPKKRMAAEERAAAKATEIVSILTQDEEFFECEDDVEKELIGEMATAAAEALQAHKSVEEAKAAAFEASLKSSSKASAEAVLWNFMSALSGDMRKADDTMGLEEKKVIASLQFMMMRIYKCDALKILEFFNLFYKNRPLNKTLCAAAILKALEKSAEAESML
ncbi:hypothetical protein ACFLR2_01105 [Chlamydiota bacterium]